MSKDGFLAGMLWGSLASGKSASAQETDKINAQNTATRRIMPQLERMHETAEFYQRNAYIQTTKLEARLDTEKALLIQLADAGLANDKRIPLANIEKFDEAYLINLIKKRQDKSIIEDRYPNGMPDDIEDEIKELNNDTAKSLKEQGYNLQQIGIKL